MKGLTLANYLRMPPAWRPPLMVADGMGVDSTALLVYLHSIGARPDAILHADVGDEWPETVAYREQRQRWCAGVGFPDLVVVRRAPSVQGSRTRRDGRTDVTYSTLSENCIQNQTLPGLVFGKKSCSLKWKVEPQNRWTDAWAPAQRAWAHGQRVVKLIGYDSGPKDSRRAHELGDDTEYNYLYPLREIGWDRPKCIAAIRASGQPVPMKSACWHCKAMKPWEVARLVVDHPELADRTIVMEDTARPLLRAVDGIWGREVKGFRGAVAKPGSMAAFIKALRANPEKLRRTLAMAPVEDCGEGGCDV